MARPKIELPGGRNRLHKVDEIKTYAVLISDNEAKPMTAMVGYIPSTGAFFYYPALDEHFTNALPKWLEKKLEKELGVKTKVTKKDASAATSKKGRRTRVGQL